MGKLKTKHGYPGIKFDVRERRLYFTRTDRTPANQPGFSNLYEVVDLRSTRGRQWGLKAGREFARLLDLPDPGAGWEVAGLPEGYKLVGRKRIMSCRLFGNVIFQSPNLFILHGMSLAADPNVFYKRCLCTMCTGEPQQKLAREFELPYKNRKPSNMIRAYAPSNFLREREDGDEDDKEKKDVKVKIEIDDVKIEHDADSDGDWKMEESEGELEDVPVGGEEEWGVSGHVNEGDPDNGSDGRSDATNAQRVTDEEQIATDDESYELSETTGSDAASNGLSMDFGSEGERGEDDGNGDEQGQEDKNLNVNRATTTEIERDSESENGGNRVSVELLESDGEERNPSSRGRARLPDFWSLMKDVVDALVLKLDKRIERLRTRGYTTRDPLPTNHTKNLWIANIIYDSDRPRISIDVLKGFLFVARCLQDALDDDKLPHADSVWESIITLDDDERKQSGIDSFFAVGGTVDGMLRALTRRAAARQLCKVRVILRAEEVTGVDSRTDLVGDENISRP